MSFENTIDIFGGNEKRLDPDSGFGKMIQKLEQSKSGLLEILKSLNDQEREIIDKEVLNPESLSWMAFNAVEKEKEDKIIELINSIKEETDSEKRKTIGKELVQIIS